MHPHEEAEPLPFAPWFYDLDEQESHEYVTRHVQIINDLGKAIEFVDDNKYALPIDQYLTIQLQYVIHDDLEDARERFAAIAERVAAQGGQVRHLQHVNERSRSTVQHTAILPLGHGRVEYRALWIEEL